MDTNANSGAVTAVGVDGWKRQAGLPPRSGVHEITWTVTCHDLRRSAAERYGGHGADRGGHADAGYPWTRSGAPVRARGGTALPAKGSASSIFPAPHAMEMVESPGVRADRYRVGIGVNISAQAWNLIPSIKEV